MRDVHDACREWLEGQDGMDKVTEFDVEELEMFVRAQRIAAAYQALDRLGQRVRWLGPARRWKAGEVPDMIRSIRETVEREET